MPKRLPKSVRKFIRQEKSRIRRQVLDMAEQKKLIAQLYHQFLSKINLLKDGNKIKNQNAKIKMTNQNAK